MSDQLDATVQQYPPFHEPHSSWYAVRVRSSAERLAAKQIAAIGYEHFVPTYVTRRRWSDRMKEVQAPLFPGYVFCRMNPVERLPVLKCSHVVEVVSAGRIPLEIDETEVESIRRVVEASSPVAPCPYLWAGQVVELDRGPLRGLSGILVEDKSSLVVSITMLQRSVRVAIDEAWVDPRCYGSSGSVPKSRVA